MKVEVYHEESGLRGGREVWVKVLSNEAMDWPRISAHLDDETRETLKGYKLDSWYPHPVSDEEREEHTYLTEEWFVWTDKS